MIEGNPSTNLVKQKELVGSGELTVVKVGGSEGINLDRVCQDVAELFKSGRPIILVHGGSHETNIIAEQLGHPSVFVTSVSGHQSRHTDRETLAIFEMVYCGKINKQIVETLQRLGVNAIGLSGIDGGLLRGKRKKALRIIEGDKKRVLKDDFTGTVERVNRDLLKLLMDNGYLPVICPPAISEEGEAINVDGDRAAAMIAAEMGAAGLIILSNTPGFLGNFPDESSLVSCLDVTELQALSENPKLGRFRSKLLAAKEAIRGEVGNVIFASGCCENPITNALRGNGTVISFKPAR